MPTVFPLAFLQAMNLLPSMQLPISPTQKTKQNFKACLKTVLRTVRGMCGGIFLSSSVPLFHFFAAATDPCRAVLCCARVAHCVSPTMLAEPPCAFE